MIEFPTRAILGPGNPRMGSMYMHTKFGANQSILFVYFNQ